MTNESLAESLRTLVARGWLTWMRDDFQKAADLMLRAAEKLDDARVGHFPRATGNDADPAEGGWKISPAYLRRVKEAIKSFDATFIDMEDIEAVLMAVEKVEGASNGLSPTETAEDRAALARGEIPAHIASPPGMSDRVYHIAHKIRPDGAVSPWCAKKPRALNLERESWTFDYERATCDRCKAAYRESNRPDAESAPEGHRP